MKLVRVGILNFVLFDCLKSYTLIFCGTLKTLGHFRFASLQSQIGKSLLIRANKKSYDLSSIVLIDKETAYFKSEAVIRIAKKLEYPIPLLAFIAMLIPNFIRNIFYEFVSNNRHRFGIREDSCRLEDEQFDSRFIPDPSTNNEDES